MISPPTQHGIVRRQFREGLHAWPQQTGCDLRSQWKGLEQGDLDAVQTLRALAAKCIGRGEFRMGRFSRVLGGSCQTLDSMGSSVKLTNRLTSTATTTVMPKG